MSTVAACLLAAAVLLAVLREVLLEIARIRRAAEADRDVDKRAGVR